MKLSICINTCALASHAQEVTGSHTSTPHAMRAWALRNFILPALIDSPHVDEVIVAGEWEEGEGYTYVSSPSVFRSCVDALAQRQAAFEASHGDVVGFVHDDHMLHTETLWSMKNVWRFQPADVLVPYRFARTSRGIVQLNNGMQEPPLYVGGHAAFYSRDILLAAPWGDVPKVHVWDTAHTKMLNAANARIREVGVVYDVEAGVYE